MCALGGGNNPVLSGYLGEIFACPVRLATHFFWNNPCCVQSFMPAPPPLPPALAAGDSPLRACARKCPDWWSRKLLLFDVVASVCAVELVILERTLLSRRVQRTGVVGLWRGNELQCTLTRTTNCFRCAPTPPPCTQPADFCRRHRDGL
jgi:hypothetical protein